MASNEVAILVSGSEPAPLAYTVPSAQEVQPLCCNAIFDGSGAAGPFLPAIEIVSDAGYIIGRVPCSTSVAAGASAEVTFAPFLRGATSGSTFASSITATGNGAETIPANSTAFESIGSTAGVLYTCLFPFTFTPGETLTGMGTETGSGVSAPATGGFTYGLCDTTGLVIAETASLGAVFFSSGPGWFSAPFTAAATVPANGILYGFMHAWDGTWTHPSVLGAVAATSQQTSPLDWHTVFGGTPPRSADSTFGTTPPALGATVNLKGKSGSANTGLVIYMSVH